MSYRNGRLFISLSVATVVVGTGAFIAGFGDDQDGFDATGRHVSTLPCTDATIAIVLSTLTPGRIDDDAEIRALQQQIDALSH